MDRRLTPARVRAFRRAGLLALAAAVAWAVPCHGQGTLRYLAFRQGPLLTDTDCDLYVTSNPDTNMCCFNLSMFNTHKPQGPIDLLDVRILTPGVKFETMPVGPWFTNVVTDSTISFTYPGSDGMPPNDRVDDFVFCFARQGNDPLAVSLQVTTEFRGVRACRDTIDLVCGIPGSECDLITLESGSADCCPIYALHNSNREGNPANMLEFQVLTPGAQIVPGSVAGPWSSPFITETRALFVDAHPLLPGEVLRGLQFCLQNQLGNPSRIAVAFNTGFEGLFYCRDTVFVDCIPSVTCDNVDIQDAGRDGSACCYSLRVSNRHQPAGPIDGLRLTLPAGGSFASASDVPWPVTSSSQTEIVFASASGPLDPDATVSGFTTCVNGINGTVPLLWTTLRGDTVVCTDTLLARCLPVQSRCDSVSVENPDECLFDLAVANLHEPSSPLTGVHVRTVTGGATLAPAGQPGGWNTAQPGADRIDYTTAGSGIAVGAQLTGFRFTLAPPIPGQTVLLEWCTDDPAGAICCDTLAVRCTPQTSCDSTIAVPLADPCAFGFTLLNRHTPVSPVNGFRVSIQTPGATVSDARPPAGWIVAGATGTQFTLRDTAGSVAPGATISGIAATFQKATGNDNVFVQWCSLLDGRVICCGTALLRCASTEARCDTVLVAPSPAACTFDLSVLNGHAPASPLDGLRIQLRTPGAGIASLVAPPGWDVTSSGGTIATAHYATGTIPSGGAETGFVLSLVPGPGGGGIDFAWCTLNGAATVCCDSVRVECTPQERICDTLALRASNVTPCCFDLAASNLHLPASPIDGVKLDILDPGVALIRSRVSTPPGWSASSSSNGVNWHTSTAPIPADSTFAGFAACFDNSAVAHRSFLLTWTTLSSGAIVCADTVLMVCDESLGVPPAAAPEAIALEGFPNPFSGRATLAFVLPRSEDVRIAIRDVFGRIVERLGGRLYGAGRHEEVFAAHGLPSGMYTAEVVTASGLRASTYLVLLR